MKKNAILSLGLIAVLFVTLVFIGSCAPAEGSEQGAGISSIYMIVFLLVIMGLFYFFSMRGQRKRQKEHQNLIENLKKGDQVITTGGIYGQIESVSEDNVVLKVESGAAIRVAKGSIVGKRER